MKLMRTHYLDASAIVEKQIGVRSTLLTDHSTLGSPYIETV